MSTVLSPPTSIFAGFCSNLGNSSIGITEDQHNHNHNQISTQPIGFCSNLGNSSIGITEDQHNHNRNHNQISTQPILLPYSTGQTNDLSNLFSVSNSTIADLLQTSAKTSSTAPIAPSSSLLSNPENINGGGGQSPSASLFQHSVRVFNPEAFCELCQKEFCNKYYLQTHKATKHGAPQLSLAQLMNTSTASSSFMSNTMTDAANAADLQNMMLAALDQSLGVQNPLRALYLSQLLTGQSPENLSMDAAAQMMAPWMSALLPPSMSQSSAQSPTGTSTASVSSLLEQMQMMSAAQNLLASQPQNLLASQPQISALAAALSGGSGQAMGNGAPPLTPTAFMNNYNNSPNKEAYCELCDKHFCNKYFLRTHRAKKHGLDDALSPIKLNFPSGLGLGCMPKLEQTKTPPMTTQSMLDQPQSVIMSTSYSPTAAKNMKMDNSSSFHFDSAAKNMKMDSDSSFLFNSSAKNMKMDESSFHFDERNNGSEQSKPAIRSALDSLLASGASEGSDCDLCGKHFSSPFVLLAHKAREHQSTQLINESNGEQPRTPSKTPTMSNEDHGSIKAMCELCDKEFSSHLYLQQHQMLMHGAKLPSSQSNQLMASPLSSALLHHQNTAFPFVFPQVLQQHLQAEQDNYQQQSQQYTAMNNKTGLKRTYSSSSSSGKNYCDLCNKEVCNKYFLRTHMLKMHGIVIDENKAVIANIDTLEKEKAGSLSFRCDLCMTELKTRQLLRTHKQEIHGVVALGVSAMSSSSSSSRRQSSPENMQAGSLVRSSNGANGGTTESMVNVCPVCDGRFKNSAMLQVHLEKEHRHEMSAEQLDSLRQMAAARTLQCEFCDETFSDEIDVKVHVINTHSSEVMAQSHRSSLTNGTNNEFVRPEDYAPMTNGSSEASEGSSIEEKMVVCNLCNREYRTMAAMQKHRLNMHRWQIKVSPTKNRQHRPLISPTKLNKLERPFVCIKCQQRFTTRQSCMDHLILHLGPDCTTAQLEQHVQEDSTTTMGDHRPSAVDEVVKELHEQLSRRHSHHKEERHSHTSGSTSPVSEQLGEGFARPTQSQHRPFTVQSFLMRERGKEGDGQQQQFLGELLAHLPVRSLVSEPVTITFDLVPAPQVDALVRHL